MKGKLLLNETTFELACLVCIKVDQLPFFYGGGGRGGGGRVGRFEKEILQHLNKEELESCSISSISNIPFQLERIMCIV